MNTTDYIRLIEQQRKEQDSIYHNIATKFGLSDTAMWVLYNVYTSDDVITQQELCRQCFFAKQTVNTAITSLSKNGYVELEVIRVPEIRKKVCLPRGEKHFPRLPLLRLLRRKSVPIPHLLMRNWIYTLNSQQD